MLMYVAFKLFEYKQNKFTGNLSFWNLKNAQSIWKTLQALGKMKFNLQFIFG